MTKISDIRPNKAEKEFLNLAYNRFYDIFEEIFTNEFWTNKAQYRLSRIKEAFGIYSELLNYEPLTWVIKNLKTTRPPMEAEIGSELFQTIRNIIIHFPFFDKWDDISINKSLINWNKEGQTIDKFLKKYEGQKEVKYRFWETKKKQMTYLCINFPNNYSKGDKIYLKDILSEKDGLKFAFILMKQIIDTQVENQ